MSDEDTTTVISVVDEASATFEEMTRVIKKLNTALAEMKALGDDKDKKDERAALAAQIKLLRRQGNELSSVLGLTQKLARAQKALSSAEKGKGKKEKDPPSPFELANREARTLRGQYAGWRRSGRDRLKIDQRGSRAQGRYKGYDYGFAPNVVATGQRMLRHQFMGSPDRVDNYSSDNLSFLDSSGIHGKRKKDSGKDAFAKLDAEIEADVAKASKEREARAAREKANAEELAQLEANEVRLERKRQRQLAAAAEKQAAAYAQAAVDKQAELDALAALDAKELRLERRRQMENAKAAEKHANAFAKAAEEEEKKQKQSKELADKELADRKKHSDKLRAERRKALKAAIRHYLPGVASMIYGAPGSRGGVGGFASRVAGAVRMGGAALGGAARFMGGLMTGSKVSRGLDMLGGAAYSVAMKLWHVEKALATFRAVFTAAAAPVTMAVRAASEYEEQRLRVAGEIHASRTDRGTASWQNSMDVAQSAMMTMQKFADVLPGDTEDYISALQKSSAFLAGAGMGHLADKPGDAGQISTVSKFMGIAMAHGIEGSQAARDLALMLSGRVTRRTASFATLAPHLSTGGDAKAWNKLSAKDRLDEITKLFDQYKDLLEAYTNTWSAQAGTLRSNIRIIGVEGGRELYDQFIKGMVEFNNKLGSPEVRGKLIGLVRYALSGVADKAKGAMGGAKVGLDMFMKNQGVDAMAMLAKAASPLASVFSQITVVMSAIVGFFERMRNTMSKSAWDELQAIAEDLGPKLVRFGGAVGGTLYDVLVSTVEGLRPFFDTLRFTIMPAVTSSLSYLGKMYDYYVKPAILSMVQVVRALAKSLGIQVDSPTGFAEQLKRLANTVGAGLKAAFDMFIWTLLQVADVFWTVGNFMSDKMAPLMRMFGFNFESKQEVVDQNDQVTAARSVVGDLGGHLKQLDFAYAEMAEFLADPQKYAAALGISESQARARSVDRVHEAEVAVSEALDLYRDAMGELPLELQSQLPQSVRDAMDAMLVDDTRGGISREGAAEIVGKLGDIVAAFDKLQTFTQAKVTALGRNPDYSPSKNYEIEQREGAKKALAESDAKAKADADAAAATERARLGIITFAEAAHAAEIVFGRLSALDVSRIGSIVDSYALFGSSWVGGVKELAKNWQRLPVIEAFKKTADVLLKGRDEDEKTGGGTTYDFRGSRFTIEQRFADGFDPDRVAVGMMNDLAGRAQRRVDSGLKPLYSGF